MKKRILLILLAVLAIAGGGYGAWAKWGVKAEAPKQVAVQKVEAPRSVYTPVPEEPKATVASLFAAVNAERAKVGIPALVLDERLNRSAQVKADDMRNRNYVGHIDPDGKHGYEYAREYASNICMPHVSENLILDSRGPMVAPTHVIIDAWISSELHYKAMVSQDYAYTGFGINKGLVVEHFCKP